MGVGPYQHLPSVTLFLSQETVCLKNSSSSSLIYKKENTAILAMGGGGEGKGKGKELDPCLSAPPSLSSHSTPYGDARNPCASSPYFLGSQVLQFFLSLYQVQSGLGRQYQL